jgi:hypothetical protein
MYKPDKLDRDVITFAELCDALDKANEEIVKHCNLIAALQAMNCTLLDRIRVLEEPRLK